MSIAIAVLTYNRVELLRQCVENVLARTSEATTEIVVWNNASTDGTAAYLDSIRDPRIDVVHHDRNIGLNGYRRAFARTTADYLVDLDDDIVDAPPNWDETLRAAFDRLPSIGFLAANLVDNPHDVTSRIMYGAMRDRYRIEDVDGIRLKVGPVGGGCALTSRALYDRVGGFPEKKRALFWQEDAEFIRSIERLGYRAAYLDDLQVLHAGGEHYSRPAAPKVAYWNAYHRADARRRRVKRIVMRVPVARHAFLQLKRVLRRR